MPSYTNALYISQSGKGIPYFGDGTPRADGEANYGFTNLKGHPDRIAAVPELARDEVLRDCIASLNESASAFGSVGCLSAPVEEPEGHRVTGYIEFAFDSAERIGDAANYFPLFFHFDGALHRVRFSDEVHFHWELMGATFGEANASGFTMTVTINTGWHGTEGDARQAWASGLDFLAGFLRQVPPDGGRPVFISG